MRNLDDDPPVYEAARQRKGNGLGPRPGRPRALICKSMLSRFGYLPGTSNKVVFFFRVLSVR